MSNTATKYAEGDFSFMTDEANYPQPTNKSALAFARMDRAMMENAYTAVTAEALWDWFRNCPPPEEKGYMFWGHENLSLLNKHMDAVGHSGASYGMTLRAIESIAVWGWETYVGDTLRMIQSQGPERPKGEDRLFRASRFEMEENMENSATNSA